MNTVFSIFFIFLNANVLLYPGKKPKEANTTSEGTNNYQDDQADDVQPSTSKLQCRG